MDPAKTELEKKATDLETRLAKVEGEYKTLEKEKEALVAASSAAASTSGQRINSDEQKCLRYFGVGHVKDLLNVNTEHPNFRHVPPELKGMVKDLKRDLDVCRMYQQVVEGEPLDRTAGNEDRFSHVKGVLNSRYAKSVLAPKLKAFGSTVAGEGDEWVPTAISSSYIEEYELNRDVAARFREIRMPSNPFKLPVQTDVTVARIQGESAAAGGIAGTNFGTTEIVFDATKLTEFMPMPEELNEDSAPAILALTRQEVVRAQSRAQERAILDGDTAVTHQDSDVTAGEDARKAWDGLRKRALGNSGNGSTVDFTAGAVTVDGLRDMRTAMGKFGINVRELVWVCSPKIYNQFLDLPEVTTVEKFGMQATILQGALSALDGIPIMISEWVRDDLNAAGVHDGVTTNLSVVHLVNHSRFMNGMRRPIRVRAVMDPTPPADRWLVASWQRADFQGHVQSATEVSSALGYNIT